MTDAEKKDYREVTWDSKEVCAYYMARFCPHDLFVNTKSDLGAFSYWHEVVLDGFWRFWSLITSSFFGQARVREFMILS